MKLNWNDIDTVLLDMDGTLLDRHFDDHFWLEHVPKRYAGIHQVPLAEAKELLYGLFRSQENTLNWTDLDYWTERLGLDIPRLKREVDHLIAVHPFVVEGKVTTELVNQSLPGVVYRLTTHSPAESKWMDAVNAFVPVRYANFLDLDAAQAKWLVKSWCAALPSARSRQRAASMYSSSAFSIGKRRISTK